ncbi:MAG: SDR family NAD(P)-dependent oxidoreductase [Acidimicrobiia bacterium]|nr:SDR family NAD(P)-dependent oxidoreductase [Acidimicrobiia bacterium]
MPTAIVTGASKGLGRALANGLAEQGWKLVIDARSAKDLEETAAHLSNQTSVVAVRGDVSDPNHHFELVEAVDSLDGSVDLLVNNASTLGTTPLPQLSELDAEAFSRVLETNLVAPLRLFQTVAGRMALGGVVINISSDAAVEAYPGWGAYGASKAGLDQLSAVLAAENPDLHVYAFDPGDMRTDMHQAAFPYEDISDRPEPESVVPALLEIITERPPSGRIRADQIAAPA